jgi:hypothetical protein
MRRDTVTTRRAVAWLRDNQAPSRGEEDCEMKNVEMSVENNILTVKVDLTKEFGPSASGKTIIIATTEGNVPIVGSEDKKIGLNIYRKK